MKVDPLLLSTMLDRVNTEWATEDGENGLKWFKNPPLVERPEPEADEDDQE